MVAIELKQGATFDPGALCQLATQNLPPYAVPLFVRVRATSDLTVTFKLRKVELQRAGYNPQNFHDPLYVLDKERATYSPYSEYALEKLGVSPFPALPDEPGLD